MKFIIPAKSSSERCENKNWRPFYGEQSLVDVSVGKALGIDPRPDIWVSSDEINADAVQRYADGRGLRHIVRPLKYADNSQPMCEVIRWHAENLVGDDDLVWAQVQVPLFDNHAECLIRWTDAKAQGFDSLSVVYLLSGFVLDSRYNPIGMGFGPWQKPTQDNPLHRWPCCFHIMTRDCAKRYGMVGAKCWWFVADGPLVDIKTEADFQAARVLYADQQEC